MIPLLLFGIGSAAAAAPPAGGARFTLIILPEAHVLKTEAEASRVGLRPEDRIVTLPGGEDTVCVEPEPTTVRVV